MYCKIHEGEIYSLNLIILANNFIFTGCFSKRRKSMNLTVAINRDKPDNKLGGNRNKNKR